jgi:hypothetical protein
MDDELRRVIRDLAPIEVFDYYEGPRFYSCRDLAGQLYLIYWVDESDAGASWLYVRVSQERYSAMRRGVISISNVLASPEDHTAMVVITRGVNFDVQPISAAQIDPEWLPDSSRKLSLNDSGALPAKLADAVDLARRVQRQVLDLAFSKAANTFEMAAGKFGRSLDAVQNVIYALACDPLVNVRKVPEEVKQGNEVLVTGLFASSFGVRLQTKNSDLFADGETANAIQTLTLLISLLAVPEELAKELHRQNILARGRFKHLLRVLVDASVSVRADWGTPQGQEHKASASLDQIALALKKLEALDEATTRTVEYRGRLVGVDVQSDFFALVVEDGEIIKGKLSTAIAARQFAVPSYIVATVEETCIVDPLTDKEKWTYVLLDAVSTKA